MRDILNALGRSMRSLARLDVFGHLIWPSLVAALFWTVVAILSWTTMISTAKNWVTDETSAVIAFTVLLVVKIVVALAFMLLIYATSVTIVSVIALPMMLERVAERDYADLEQRHGGTNTGSIINTVVALLWFVFAIVAAWLLWLFPGGSLLVTIAPAMIAGWFNQRMFGYDALMRHADASEMVHLRKELRAPMLLLGCITALLAYIPVVNLVAPAFAGLAFVHFLLEALRRERQKQGILVGHATLK